MPQHQPKNAGDEPRASWRSRAGPGVQLGPSEDRPGPNEQRQRSSPQGGKGLDTQLTPAEGGTETSQTDPELEFQPLSPTADKAPFPLSTQPCGRSRPLPDPPTPQTAQVCFHISLPSGKAHPRTRCSSPLFIKHPPDPVTAMLKTFAQLPHVFRIKSEVQPRLRLVWLQARWPSHCSSNVLLCAFQGLPAGRSPQP